MSLKGTVDLDTSGAVAGAKQLQAALGSFTVAAAGVDASVVRASRSVANLATAVATESKRMNAANESSAKVFKTTAETKLVADKLAEAQAERAASTVVAAETAKRNAIKQSSDLARRLVGSAPGTKVDADANGNSRTTLGGLAAQADKRTDYLSKEYSQEMSLLRKHYQAIEAEDARHNAARRKAVQVDANPGATSQIPAGRLQRQAVGLPVEDLQAVTALSNQSAYALYNVSTSLGIMGAALTGAGIAAIGFATQYESSMATVQRTTSEAADSPALASLKQNLLDISEDIPIGFANLAEIASLGAQLGIGVGGLDEFSRSVAEFSAITGVSTEKVAQDFGALGAILDVPAEQFKNLGSSINFVGINSVATDAEILNLSASIGASAKQAKFGTANVVGLSAALASLRIQPEQARGVILRLFADFDRVTTQGGAKLEAYARVLNMTTEAATDLWKTDSEGFFDSLLKGLSTAENLNATLTGLGITETRESNVLQRLAGNYDLYTSSIQQANDAYEDGTFQSEAYGVIADTLAAKLEILGNSVTNLFAEAGKTVLPVIKPIIEFLTTMVQAIGDLPAPLLGLVTGLSLVAGSIAVIAAGGLAFIATAGLMRNALGEITRNGTGTVTVVKGLSNVVRELTAGLGLNTAAARVNAVTIGSVGARMGQTAVGAYALSAASTGITSGLGRAGVAARGFGVALLSVPILNVVAGLSIAIPVVMSIVGALSDAGGAAREAGKALLEAGGGMDSFMQAVEADTAAKLDGTSAAYGRVTVAVTEADRAKLADAESAQNTADSISNLTKSQVEAGWAVEGTSETLKAQTKYLGESSAAWITSALEQNEGILGLVNDPRKLATFQKFGGNIQKAIKLGLANDGSLGEYFDEINSKSFSAVSGEGFLSDIFGMTDSTLITGELDSIQLAIEGVVGQTETAQLVTALLGAGLGYTADEADAAAVEIINLAAAQADYSSAIKAGSSAFFGYSKIISEYQKVNTEWAKAEAESRDGSADAWNEWYDGVSVPITAFSAGLEGQIATQTTWANDIATLTASGATAFATELARMGPEGAALAAQAVQLSTDELMKLEANALLAGYLASDAYAAGFQENNAMLAEVQAQGGIEAVYAMVAAMTSAAPGAVDEVIAAYNLNLSGKPMRIQGTTEDADNKLTQFQNRAAAARPSVPINATAYEADNELTRFINRVNSSSATVTVRTSVENGGRSRGGSFDASANGNMYTGPKVEAFANGGFPTGIYAGRSGGIHKFAEPETRWEAYISGKAGQEARNLKIWGEAGKRLGVDYAPTLAKATSAGDTFANGGLTLSPTGTPVFQDAGSAFTGFNGSANTERDALAQLFSRMGGGSGGTPAGTVVNATVVQNYPTTVDPIKTLKRDAESVLAGIWT